MKFKLALVQCRHPENGDVVSLVDGYLAKARDAQADIVVFPESLMTPYEASAEQILVESEELDGPFCSSINELAGKYGLWVVYTANERNVDGSRPFNTAVVVDDKGEVRGSYRKTHLFDTDLTRESDKVMPGYELFAPLETPFGKLGLGICYDLRFPELARAAALAGCDILVFPSAWVDGPGKVRQWKTLLSARAIENEMFVAGVSRCDREFGADARDYAGNSCVFDPLGNEIAAVGLDEAVLIAEIDTAEISRTRAAMPVLEHRHVELYGTLLERNAQKYGVVLDEGGEPVEAYEGSLKYIFASYSHRDISIVYPILASLQRMGFRIWYDPGIQPGYEWEPFVMEHVDNCACCLFFSSASSLSSMYCQREVVAARKLDKDILVINLDGSDFSWLAQYNLELLQHVFRSDFSDDKALTDAIASADIIQPCKDTYEIVESEDRDGNKVVTLTSYLGGSSEIVVPDGVTHIGESAFTTPNVRKIVLPDGVVEIGRDAFAGCGHLESVRFPASLRRIEHGAFSRCGSLETITLPESISFIGDRAFYGCLGLLAADLSSTSIDRINSEAFSNCQSLQVVNLPSSLKLVVKEAFKNCASLSHLVLPDCIKAIHHHSFYGCAHLELSIPASLHTLGPHAFRGCKSFSFAKGSEYREQNGMIISLDGKMLIDGTSLPFGNHATIPEGVESICNSAFQGADWLTSAEIPSSVREIGEKAFRGCKNVTEFRLSDNVQSIGKEAFFNSGVETVKIPRALAYVPDSAFTGCQALKTVELGDSVQRIEDYAFADCPNLKDMSLPANLEYIGSGAFAHCRMLNIALPKSVKSIGGDAFYDCKSLTIDSANEALTLKDGMILSKDEQTLLSVVDMVLDMDSYTVPEGVKVIVNGAFAASMPRVFNMGCANEIILPESLERVGEHVFYLCNGVKRIVIPGCGHPVVGTSRDINDKFLKEWITLHGEDSVIRAE